MLDHIHFNNTHFRGKRFAVSGLPPQAGHLLVLQYDITARFPGNVWLRIELDKTVVDLGFGLRYYLRNFVVRFDTGISEESIGLYFYFGHVF